MQPRDKLLIGLALVGAGALVLRGSSCAANVCVGSRAVVPIDAVPGPYAGLRAEYRDEATPEGLDGLIVIVRSVHGATFDGDVVAYASTTDRVAHILGFGAAERVDGFPVSSVSRFDLS